AIEIAGSHHMPASRKGGQIDGVLRNPTCHKPNHVLTMGIFPHEIRLAVSKEIADTGKVPTTGNLRQNGTGNRFSVLKKPIHVLTGHRAFPDQVGGSIFVEVFCHPVNSKSGDGSSESGDRVGRPNKHFPITTRRDKKFNGTANNTGMEKL